jgi:hypothetical protein
MRQLEFDTMTHGIRAMSGQHEVLPVRTETGEKCLRAFGVAKAAHLAFASAGGLVGRWLCSARLFTLAAALTNTRLT